MKTKEVTAMRISRQIHALEDSIDLLLAQAGTLTSEMTHYRVETNLDANIGQRAITRVVELQGKLAEARMKAVGAHSDLKKIIETTADFPFDCPEGGEAPPLTEVRASLAS